MKKRTILFIINIVLIIAAVIARATSMNANELSPQDMMDGELYQVEATAYCDEGVTATGKKAREGICAGAPEWFGTTIAVYDENLEFLGYWECEDTGSQPIKEGKVIDLYFKSYTDCIQFGRQKVYIAVIPSEG